MALLEWFFTETIYGIFLLCLPVYGAAWVVKKFFKAAPHPGSITFLAGLALLMTVPSFPRYQFQTKGLQMAQDHPEYKLVSKAGYGDFLEPLTLINTPIGFFQFVSPDPLSYREGEDNQFHEVILRYKEDRQEKIVHAYCKDKTVEISEPDSKGMFRHTTDKPKEMNKWQEKDYCQTNYSEQVEAIRSKIVSSGK